MNTQSQWEQAVLQVDQMAPGHSASEIVYALRQNWNPSDVEESMFQAAQQLRGNWERGVYQLNRTSPGYSAAQLAQAMRPSWNPNDVSGSVNQGAQYLRNMGGQSGQGRRSSPRRSYRDYY